MSTTSALGDTQLPRLTAAVMPGLLAPVTEKWPAHILVSADDSASTGDALVAASALATRSAALVDVLTVFAPRVPVPNVAANCGARCEKQDRSAAAELVCAVRFEQRQRFEGHEPWPVQLEVGDPVRAIAERARRTRADLVVVGLGSRDPIVRRGRSGVPVGLSRYTEVPVLAAAPMLTALPREAVLFVDRESPDRWMIRATLRCLEQNAFVWVLIHSGTTVRSGDGVKRDKNTLARILQLVRREAANVSKGIVVRAVYRSGDPVDAVLALAREVNADLIAAAVHGAPGTIRSLVPNIADRLLLTAPCSVLIAPTSEC